MRVLLSSWDLPAGARGGTPGQVIGLANAMAAAGHDVVVFTTARPGVDERAEREGPVRVLRADADLPWIPDTRHIARVASANHAIVRLADELLRERPGWRPDVVHGHDWQVGWAADSLAGRFDAPFVLTLHATERVRHSGSLPAGEPTDVAAIEWWLAFRADRLIGTTRFVVDQLVEGFELSPERIDCVPNGIDRAAWSPRPDVPAPDPTPHVVSWGRVDYEKGFQILARAMSTVRHRVPGARCTIAGRGSYLPELQTQIDVEGVSDLVELRGFVASDGLRRLANDAGCIVIPSLYEPFGIVALEALAAGAPLIVARTGGLAELVGDTGAALTFEPGDPTDLAGCIERILGDQGLRDELTARARRLVETEYSWASIVDATTAVYERARSDRDSVDRRGI